MKPINFIKPFTKQKHHEIIYWFRISCILFTLLIGTLSIVQWRTYRELKKIKFQKKALEKELAPLRKMEETIKKDLTKKENLTKKIDFISTMKKSPENPYHFLEEIFKITNKHSLSIKSVGGSLEKTIEIQGESSNAQNLTNCIHDLTMSPLINSASLVSIATSSTNKNMLGYTIKIAYNLEYKRNNQ